MSSFFMSQGNLAESYLKIAVYLTSPCLIPYKISHVYLPEMSVRMTYPSHPRKTRNTRIAHLCILNVCHSSFKEYFFGAYTQRGYSGVFSTPFCIVNPAWNLTLYWSEKMIRNCTFLLPSTRPCYEHLNSR